MESMAGKNLPKLQQQFAVPTFANFADPDKTKDHNFGTRTDELKKSMETLGGPQKDWPRKVFN